MKITICGSIAFFAEMLETKTALEEKGHEVKLPPTEVADEQGKMIPVARYYELRKTITDENSWVWQRKEEAMRAHFDKVAWADIVLVLNYDKKGIAGYIGANTLIEMGLALYLRKPIYLLNPIPEMDSKEEILGMRPVVLYGDLTRLSHFSPLHCVGCKVGLPLSEENKQQIRVIVASQNPVKIAAAKAGFEKMFPDNAIDVKGVSASSEVSDQPKSEEETLRGATNRAVNVARLEPNGDYFVGLEGGIHDKNNDMHSFSWVVIQDKSGKTGKGQSGEYVLPTKIRELILSGHELGDADDKVFGKSNSKQKNGAVGILTHDAIDRAGFYEQAVILALIPFRNETLY